jgi:tRNA uridine 5-carbamoylmethylation protein Kti12
MSFYKEIVPFVEYIHSIRKLETYLSFDMKFPIKWSIPKNIVDEGQVIAFEVEDQNTKGITFICPINEKEVSSILVKIGKTIKLNKERELKERLFKQTVEQLIQTFEKTDLDKLQNLYFDFDEGELDTDLDGEIETKLEDEQNGQESTVVELVQQ